MKEILEEKKIAVVIPCYRVSRHIEQVVSTIPDWVDHIVVVDDKCPDGSGQLAEAVADDRILVVSHEQNQGVGGAMITGYKQALALACDIVVKMDGDGQMAPEYLEALIQPLLDDRADYTKGNRFYDFKRLKDMPSMRLFGNSVISFLVKAASGYWNIMDAVNGYTAVTSEALSTINLDSLSRRYFFESDMLVNLGISRRVVIDVPIPALYGDEESSMSLKQVAVTFPWMLFKRLCRRIFLNYFLYDFNVASLYMLLGIPMLLWGVGFGAFHWISGVQTGELNSVGTVMLAAVPVILGLQFIMQAVAVDVANVPQKKAKEIK